MRIDIRSLLAGETDKITLDYTFSLTDKDSAEEIPFDTEIEGVAFTEPVHITGEIVNMGGYIKLTAKASVGYDAVCARCLAPLHRNFSVDFERTVVGKDTLENTADESDEYIEFVNDGLVIDETAAEELVMDFPTRELCREDCKGLCHKCGKNLNDGDCGCPKKEIDPRLAILQKLLEKS